jgi:bacterial/archaeal transporter family protein
MSAKAYPYLLAVITLIFWGIAPIFGKIGLLKINPLTGLAIRSFVISFILLILVFSTGTYKEFGTITLKGFSFIALEGIFASLIGHFAYYYALKLGETSKIVPITSAFPVITVILAVAFLAEKMTVFKGAGIALIVAGIYLIRF